MIIHLKRDKATVLSSSSRFSLISLTVDFRGLKWNSAPKGLFGPLFSSLDLSATEKNPGVEGFCVAGLVDLRNSSFCRFSVGGKWVYFPFSCILSFSQS